MDSRIRRRNILAMAGVTFTAPYLASCDSLSTDPAGEGAGGDGVDREKGGEAPQLAELVERGDLPSVEERLPSNPLVVEPVDRVGRYGGRWVTALSGPADRGWLNRTMAYENLTRWSPEFDDVLPNVAEDFEIRSDGAEYEFKLREGIKWSDGEPFTADDLVFVYEDVLLNEEITPSMPSWLVSGDEPVVVEKIDDYTVAFTFAEPNGLFLQNMSSTWYGEIWTDHPRHYLEQFHAKYNSGIDALVEDEGFDNWVDLFNQKAAFHENAKRPVLFAWQLKSVPSESSSRAIAERNPYYWKVDPDGSQLPYLDKVEYELVSDQEMILLKATNGDFNMHSRQASIFTPTNKPVLARGGDEGNYEFFNTVLDIMNEVLVLFNLSHKDDVKRQIFQNQDFRIGLSHAINREEIRDTIFQQQGEPWQAAPRPESDFFNERLAKQYTDYDVEEANRYLDRAGFGEMDDDGFRLGPDGNRIELEVEVSAADRNPIYVETLELIRGYWRGVGVDIGIDPKDDTLLFERIEANEHDAAIWSGGGGLDVVLSPYYYFPFHWNSKFAPAWGHWFNGEAGAEEPVEAAREQMELYQQLRRTPGEEEQNELMRRILDIAAEQFWVIGTVQLPEGYAIVKENFHNVPDPMVVVGNSFPEPAPTNPCQYFVEG